LTKGPEYYCGWQSEYIIEWVEVVYIICFIIYIELAIFFPWRRQEEEKKRLKTKPK